MQHINDMIGRFFKYEEFRNKRILSEKYISLKMFTVIHYSSFDPIFSLDVETQNFRFLAGGD